MAVTKRGRKITLAYFQEKLERASRDEMAALQNDRFTSIVKHTYENVPIYREKMKAAGVEVGDIKSIDDLHKLPFLSKDDLREAYPYGFLAKPLADCVSLK
jgi:phenylacetate-CoA ligase